MTVSIFCDVINHVGDQQTVLNILAGLVRRAVALALRPMASLAKPASIMCRSF